MCFDDETIQTRPPSLSDHLFVLCIGNHYYRYIRHSFLDCLENPKSISPLKMIIGYYHIEIMLGDYFIKILLSDYIHKLGVSEFFLQHPQEYFSICEIVFSNEKFHNRPVRAWLHKGYTSAKIQYL